MAKAIRKRQAELDMILKMMIDCNSDAEIMSTLKIPYATFYRYKAKLFQEYAEKFVNQRMIMAGLWTELLHARLNKYLKIIEGKLEESEGKDAAALGTVAVETSKTIFDLETQGLELVTQISLDDLDKSLVKLEPNNNNNSGNNGNNTKENRVLQQD
jgi:hypothetical protein